MGSRWRCRGRGPSVDSLRDVSGPATECGTACGRSVALAQELQTELCPGCRISCSGRLMCSPRLACALRVREAHERAQAFVYSMCTRDAKQPLTSIKGTLVKFGSQKLLLLLLQKISPLFLRVSTQTGVHMVYEDGFCWVGFCVGLVRVVGCGKLC